MPIFILEIVVTRLSCLFYMVFVVAAVESLRKGNVIFRIKSIVCYVINFAMMNICNKLYHINGERDAFPGESAFYMH